MRAVGSHEPQDDGIIHAKGSPQKWRMAGIARTDRLHQVVSEKRSFRREPGEQRQAIGAGRREQAEHQVHGWQLLRDVVLQVAVELFVAQIERRGQADQERVEVESVQPEHVRQVQQPQRDIALFGFFYQRSCALGCPGQLVGKRSLLFRA